MDILGKIVAVKKREVRRNKKVRPVKDLEKSPFFSIPVRSFYGALNKPFPAIIAEFKRKSPSKGIINNTSQIDDVAKGYFIAGVSAMSILTDKDFFGGSINDLSSVAGLSLMPLLRKDFIIDEYQVIEARSAGASAILLIGSILSRKLSSELTRLAFSLGMEVLFEIHELKDLEVMENSVRIIGVNNRNLSSFKVDRKKSVDMLSHLPGTCLKIAESGFETPDEVQKMFTCGYNAFLIGERFMRSGNPGKSAAEFISALK